MVPARAAISTAAAASSLLIETTRTMVTGEKSAPPAVSAARGEGLAGVVWQREIPRADRGEA